MHHPEESAADLAAGWLARMRPPVPPPPLPPPSLLRDAASSPAWLAGTIPVHEGPAVDRAAAELGARGFSFGGHVFLGAQASEQVLRHELHHAAHSPPGLLYTDEQAAFLERHGLAHHPTRAALHAVGLALPPGHTEALLEQRTGIPATLWTGLLHGLPPSVVVGIELAVLLESIWPQVQAAGAEFVATATEALTDLPQAVLRELREAGAPPWLTDELLPLVFDVAGLVFSVLGPLLWEIFRDIVFPFWGIFTQDLPNLWQGLKRLGSGLLALDWREGQAAWTHMEQAVLLALGRLEMAAAVWLIVLGGLAGGATAGTAGGGGAGVASGGVAAPAGAAGGGALGGLLSSGTVYSAMQVLGLFLLAGQVGSDLRTLFSSLAAWYTEQDESRSQGYGRDALEALFRLAVVGAIALFATYAAPRCGQTIGWAARKLLGDERARRVFDRVHRLLVGPQPPTGQGTTPPGTGPSTLAAPGPRPVEVGPMPAGRAPPAAAPPAPVAAPPVAARPATAAPPPATTAGPSTTAAGPSTNPAPQSATAGPAATVEPQVAGFNAAPPRGAPRANVQTAPPARETASTRLARQRFGNAPVDHTPVGYHWSTAKNGEPMLVRTRIVAHGQPLPRLVWTNKPPAGWVAVPDAVVRATPRAIGRWNIPRSQRAAFKKLLRKRRVLIRQRDAARAQAEGLARTMGLPREDVSRLLEVASKLDPPLTPQQMRSLRQAVADWRAAHHGVGRVSETIGEKAALAYMRRHYPGAQLVFGGRGRQGGGQGVFDQVWKIDGNPPRYIVVEAKGGGGRMGQRQIGGRMHEQGTPEYLRDVAKAMSDRPGFQQEGAALREAIRKGHVDYLLLRTPTNVADGQALVVRASQFPLGP